jgi:hypothetical protein
MKKQIGNEAKNRIVREAMELAIVKWAEEQMQIRGDIFATTEDLENIKSDPIGFMDLLNGEDAKKFAKVVFHIFDPRY